MRSTSEALAQLRAANPVPATYATMSEARGSTSHGRGRTRAGLLVAATAGVVLVALVGIRHRTAEAADGLAEIRADVLQPLGAEQQDHDHQDDQAQDSKLAFI